jgi:hypothetical protein
MDSSIQFLWCLLQVKLEKNQNGKPSKVIHIRNIPNEVTEAEIIHLGIPFGRVTNVLVLKGKNQVCLPRLRDRKSSLCLVYVWHALLIEAIFQLQMAPKRERLKGVFPARMSTDSSRFS